MSYKDIINELAGSMNMKPEKVDKIYKYYWLFIKDHIESLNVKEADSIPKDIKTSFNIPSLGKLAIQKNIEDIKKYIKKHDKSKDD